MTLCDAPTFLLRARKIRSYVSALVMGMGMPVPAFALPKDLQKG